MSLEGFQNFLVCVKKLNIFIYLFQVEVMRRMKQPELIVISTAQGLILLINPGRPRLHPHPVVKKLTFEYLI